LLGGTNAHSYLTVNPKIDSQLAWRHIMTCLKSFEPKHEHKMAGVGYLLSLWFLSFREEKTEKPLVYFARLETAKEQDT